MTNHTNGETDKSEEEIAQAERAEGLKTRLASAFSEESESDEIVKRLSALESAAGINIEGQPSLRERVTALEEINRAKAIPREATPQTPSIGRDVHFSMDRGPSVGQPRSAKIVRMRDGTNVNLQVFTDGGGDNLPDVVWRTDIKYDEEGKPGTWRWPPRVG